MCAVAGCVEEKHEDLIDEDLVIQALTGDNSRRSFNGNSVLGIDQMARPARLSPDRPRTNIMSLNAVLNDISTTNAALHLQYLETASARLRALSGENPRNRESDRRDRADIERSNSDSQDRSVLDHDDSQRRIGNDQRSRGNTERTQSSRRGKRAAKASPNGRQRRPRKERGSARSRKPSRQEGRSTNRDDVDSQPQSSITNTTSTAEEETHISPPLLLDSDSIESLGPPTPVIRRGRGAFKADIEHGQEEQRRTLPDIDWTSKLVDQGEKGGKTPTPEKRGKIPTPEKGGKTPTPEKRGETPTPEKRGETPKPDSASTLLYCVPEGAGDPGWEKFGQN